MARPPLLTLTDIALTFGGRPLFEGVSASVEANDRLCLVGRNGSGKSTLLKIAAGLVQPDGGERFAQPGARIDYLAQEPDPGGHATLGDWAAADLAPEERYKAEAAMAGLKVRENADPTTASGGERRRAALAKLIAGEPDLMLLDEPTNHLDVEAIEWLENYLAEGRTGYVLISHDRTFLRRLTRATLWLDRGVARRHDRGFDAFEDWRDKVFEEEDQQRHKLDRLIKAEGKWAVEGISARRKRNQGRVRRLAELRGERRDQIARTGVAAMSLEGGTKSGRLVIEGKGLAKSFGDQPIVDDFSIRIMRGQRVGFVGPNGVGKTTLVRMLTGEVAPDAGSLRHGANLETAVFDQNRQALDPDATLWNTLTGDKALGVSGRNDQVMVRGSPRHVIGYLKDFLFDERQARGPVSALSGGEKARLLLAQIMARTSNLLILDEPTNDLDMETLDLLQELLEEFSGTLLLVSHDRDFLDRVCTSVVAMEGDGQAVEYAGGWSDYRSQRQPDADQPEDKPRKTVKAEEPTQKKRTGKLSFKQTHRLDKLPEEMDRLGVEIAKLQELMADPELYARDPARFNKALEALAERQQTLQSAEDEWLELEALRESLDG